MPISSTRFDDGWGWHKLGDGKENGWLASAVDMEVSKDNSHRTVWIVINE